jgi:uncharacterized membrane protein YbhN (UPF0104 family)
MNQTKHSKLFFKVFKILTAIFFLTVIIPDRKLSVPVGFDLLFVTLMIDSNINDRLLTILPLIGFLYFLISGFNNYNSKTDSILTIITVFVFYGFLLYFTKAFINYYEVVSLTTLFLFLVVSIICLYTAKKRLKLKNNSPN